MSPADTLRSLHNVWEPERQQPMLILSPTQQLLALRYEEYWLE